MKKSILGMLVLLIIGLIFIVSCGVSADKYEEAVTNLSRVEINLETANKTISDLNAELDKYKNETEQLLEELNETKTHNEILQESLDNETQKVESLDSRISTLQQSNTSLSNELNKVLNPRFFSSQQELADWLYEDKTDTEYSDYEFMEKSYILMIRALRDGYLLPVDCDVERDYIYISNATIIGDEYNWVFASDDSVTFVSYVDPIPSGVLSSID